MALGKCSWARAEFLVEVLEPADQNLGEVCTFQYEMKCTFYTLPIYLTSSKFPAPVTPLS